MHTHEYSSEYVNGMSGGEMENKEEIKKWKKGKEKMQTGTQLAAMLVMLAVVLLLRFPV